jgi:hypothetical protein
MAINPANITTIRVDQLTNAGLTLDSLFPHTVGTELTSSTIESLVTLVASAIGSTDAVGFLPISVTDGQQLPDVPTNPGFFLCGAGTYLNINGFADLICTEALNAIMSVDDHWEIAVQIPVTPLSGTVQTVTGSAVDNTDPLNPVVNLSGATPNLQQVTDEGNETTNNIKFIIDVDNYIEVDTENRSIKIFKDGEQVANYYDNQVSLFDSALLQSLDLAPNLVNGASDDTSYRLENGTLTLVTPDGSIVITPEEITVNGIDYPLPTGTSSQIATLADITGGSGGYTVVSSNLTAVNDTNYTVVANATFTDPSPTEGKGYVVYVRNGTATIGGTGYAVGSLVFRVFHSGAWSSREYKSNLTASDIPTGIDATKIADGSVSNTEFQRLDGVTGNIQTQIDSKEQKASFMCLSAPYVGTSGTALQKIFNVGSSGNGEFNALANKAYEFTCEFDLTAMATSSGTFSFGFLGTATISSLTWKSIAGKGALATASTAQITSATVGTATVITGSSASATGKACVTGVIRVTGAGTIIPAFAVSVSATPQVEANSIFIIRELGSDTVTASSDIS